MTTITAISELSNDAASVIGAEAPYRAEIELLGTAAFLFHRWSVDGVEAKAKAAKGSKAKKEDDLESYVYRDAEGLLAIPTEYFRMAIVNAAKFKQDPRSPRKSAMDLFKAALVPAHEFAGLGVRDWDYVDRRRVTVQKAGITRCRPALHKGWRCRVEFEVVLPEYVGPELLNEVVQMAGRVVGVGDFRPTFGRFQVVRFRVQPQ